MSRIIEARELVKNFGANRAIDGLSLDVEAGAIYGVVGPDGAGKTTTVRLIAGVMDFDSGSVSVGGFDVKKDISKIRNIIGYMPQRFSLYEDLSVEENINFFADLYSVTGRERETHVRDLYKFSRLEEFKNRLAINLSGGMQKKLALTCALINFPKILILDEPTIGVDPLSREELWSMLFSLNKKDGITILVTTSYMDEVERFDSVGLIYKGKLLKTGTPAEIARGRDSFEDAFIANIKEAGISRDKGMS